MRVIDHRPYRNRRAKRQLRRPLKWCLLILGGLTALFLLVNAIMWVAYRGKALPNVKAAVLPSQVNLVQQDVSVIFDAEKAGITINQQATGKRLAERSWIPLLDVVRGRRIPAVISVQQQKFTEAVQEIEPSFEKQVLPSHIVFSGNSFSLAEAVPGHRLDRALFTKQIKDTFARGNATLKVPLTPVTSDSTGAGLAADLSRLNDLLKLKVVFSVNGQARQASITEMGSWFEAAAHPSGQTMVLSRAKIKAYVLGLAPAITNATNAAAAASYAFDKKVDITFVVSADAPVKYTYCVGGKGVGEGHMPNFMAKVAATLGDPRGWNAGGKVSFEQVENDCDFTVWLSAPAQMTSFGGLCDSYYSCRSGRNVVINFDRWQGATDPWNASGGSLEDYRVMVTNHEVGHWLGFGHANCSGPGQPAPVMQQQSISLQGCMFNPWPTGGEINTLKHGRGIAGLHPRGEYATASTCACGKHA